ncbi:MAG: hypothetical protein A3B10_03935 [Candidatus Doudnabacteria bacterium RIFCSPLOWO2_01_FULL_44_21]|uniref:DUF559 domain-containing protein n=1 Tax=Candidatus Doudnabacteria bacterium RIFCSPLOWO2_01_FULL_44_21 TaxID=1817841 RepID=A0A1F5PYI3_9BACT|nr:MAG: hypothetical protein A3B95_01910 [Candidatus Doudnabacteria bacterium RIFCSPHIGHO2_02_FULL_43_13b]OGE94907.1 MAG: hypothetical protein A3B10_03935 [Candidatus Doudnabacteria bacterium RIFCSPLOWO2_01_FULL_44_21]
MPYLYNSQRLKLRRKSFRNNMPQSEQVLWYYLKGKNLKDYKFRRQYSVGKYILDFFCPKLRLAIELDGDSHFIDDRAKVYDKNRQKFLSSQNITVIRFTNTEISESIDGVIDKISKHLP